MALHCEVLATRSCCTYLATALVLYVSGELAPQCQELVKGCARVENTCVLSESCVMVNLRSSPLKSVLSLAFALRVRVNRLQQHCF
eukprot:6483380-Amphidinium_carterae.1